MKRLPVALILVFFIPFLFLFGGTSAIVFSAFFLISKKDSNLIVSSGSRGQEFNSVYNLFSSPPPVLGSFTSSVATNDARALTLEQFFSRYRSPLSSYGDVFISVSEKYAIPWQLLPAIAMQESLGGKNVPEECYNPFGWGIHARGTLCFETWEKGIETVAKGIKEKYIDNGLTTIEAIMSKYNPISYNRDGSWGRGVQFFLDELESFNTP